MKNTKTSKHKTKTYEKPASISKHAKTIGKLGGRPKKQPEGAINARN